MKEKWWKIMKILKKTWFFIFDYFLSRCRWEVFGGWKSISGAWRTHFRPWFMCPAIFGRIFGQNRPHRKIAKIAFFQKKKWNVDKSAEIGQKWEIWPVLSLSEPVDPFCTEIWVLKHFLREKNFFLTHKSIFLPLEISDAEKFFAEIGLKTA